MSSFPQIVLFEHIKKIEFKNLSSIKKAMLNVPSLRLLLLCFDIAHLPPSHPFGYRQTFADDVRDI